MRQWIMGVTAASLLSSIAMALTPKGRVRQVTGLVCGLMCALAVAGPLVKLDYGALAAGVALYGQRAAQLTADADEEAKMLDRTYIEDRCQAYILAKAAEAELAVQSVTLSARWDEDAHIWYPWTVAVDAPYSPRLAACIEADLGIPPQRQSWRDDG